MKEVRSEIKKYPEIDFNFYLIGDTAFLQIASVIKNTNDEELIVADKFNFDATDKVYLCTTLIEATDRFHRMCQKYINEYESNTK